MPATPQPTICIHALPPIAGRFFAGVERFEVEAGNIFGVIEALEARAPGFAHEAGLRFAFAVDGEVRNDWSSALTAGAVVSLFPRVAGGEGAPSLQTRPLEPFGIELIGDLDRPLDPAEAAELRFLLQRHGLVLVRGQCLSMQRHRALCATIGPILDREGETGFMSNEAGGPAASALAWHADAAYTDHPFEALSLHALDVVDGASSTRFIHAGGALQALDPALRARLAGNSQEMISPHYTLIAERVSDLRDPPALVRPQRPTVFAHPLSGQDLIWVSELQTTRLLDLEWEESRDLLRAVFDSIYAPERVYEHRWRKGDVIIWDNVALQHSRGSLAEVGQRVMQRVIVGSAGVAPHVAAARQG